MQQTTLVSKELISMFANTSSKALSQQTLISILIFTSTVVFMANLYLSGQRLAAIPISEVCLFDLIL